MNRLPRTIGIAFNLKRRHNQDDAYEEYDEIETISALKGELERFAFKVILLEQDERFVKKLLRTKPDFVLNITEGKGGKRSRESQVPCILESFNIPYSGSDPLSLGIALDKYLTNQFLKSYGVPVPLMYMVSQNAHVRQLQKIFDRSRYFIVKPRWEGSSRGIFNNSIVDNVRAAKERARYIWTRFQQPALIEEFLEKDEITAGVYGNQEPRILGMMRIVPKVSGDTIFLYSQENKKDWKTVVKYESESRLSQNVKTAVKKHAVRAFKALELRDIARIDFRLNSSNIPHIIDINPLPGLSPHYSDLPILFKLNGGNYSSLIRLILKEAFKRYGIRW